MSWYDRVEQADVRVKVGHNIFLQVKLSYFDMGNRLGLSGSLIDQNGVHISNRNAFTLTEVQEVNNNV